MVTAGAALVTHTNQSRSGGGRSGSISYYRFKAFDLILLRWIPERWHRPLARMYFKMFPLPKPPIYARPRDYVQDFSIDVEAVVERAYQRAMAEKENASKPVQKPE
jgi:hypothetical protein